MLTLPDLRRAAASNGHDLTAYTDLQIESAVAMVALQTGEDDPQFFGYVASIVAEMPTDAHAPSCNRGGH